MDTPIPTQRGLIKAIDVLPGDQVVGGTVTNRWVSPAPVRTWSLHFDGGLRLTVNDEHPLLTRNGYVASSDLKQGDEVALSLEPWPWSASSSPLLIEDAYFAGLMIGDGCMTHRSGVMSFTSADDQLLDWMTQYLRDSHGIEARVDSKPIEIRWCSSAFKEYMEHIWQVPMVTAHHKTIPGGVCNPETAKAFLQGYTDTDGCVYGTGAPKDRCIVWVSASESLLRQVQQMLLGFGVYATLRFERKELEGKQFDQWRLRARGPWADRFMERIGVRLDRKQSWVSGKTPCPNEKWVKIQRKAHSHEKYVVGHTVEPTNTYVTAGLKSHNSGKTQFLLAECGSWSMGVRPFYRTDDPAFRVLTARGTPIPVPNMTKIAVTDFANVLEQTILPKFKELWPEYMYTIGRNAQGYPNQINWRWGSTTHFLSHEMATTKYESGTFHGIGWDEPPPDPGKVTASRRGLMKHGGLEVFSMTPLGQPWMDQQIYENPQCEVIHFHTEDNLEENGGVLSREAFNLFISGQSEIEKQIRLHGNIGARSIKPIMYFQNEDPYVIEPFQIPHNWYRIAVIDPHELKPDAVLYWACSPDFSREVIYGCLKGEETRGTVGQTVAAMRTFESITGGPPHRCLIDPRAARKNLREIGRTIGEEFSARGRWVEPAPGVQVSVGFKMISDRFKLLPGLHRPRIQIFSTCTPLIEEMMSLRWKLKKGGLEFEENEKTVGPDDLIACFRYLCVWNPHEGLFHSPDATFRPSVVEGQVHDMEDILEQVAAATDPLDGTWGGV